LFICNVLHLTIVC